MNKITQEEFDKIPITLSNIKKCPSGNYEDILTFEERCSFSNCCVFAPYTNFYGIGTFFGESCRFGKGCNFPEKCVFSFNCIFECACDFGSKCSFLDYCYFENGCEFGNGCEFESKCFFRSHIHFGDNCKFGKNCEISDGNVIIGSTANASGFGSMNRKTTAIFTKDNIFIICGCWSGTIKEFKNRVRSIYEDNSIKEEYILMSRMFEARWKRYLDEYSSNTKNNQITKYIKY